MSRTILPAGNESFPEGRNIKVSWKACGSKLEPCMPWCRWFFRMAHDRKKPVLRIRNNLCNSEPGVVVKLANPVYKYAKRLGRHPHIYKASSFYKWCFTIKRPWNQIVWYKNKRKTLLYDTRAHERKIVTVSRHMYIFFEKEMWIYGKKK